MRSLSSKRKILKHILIDVSLWKNKQARIYTALLKKAKRNTMWINFWLAIYIINLFTKQNEDKTTAIKLNQSRLFKKWNILKCILQNSQYFTYSNWRKGTKFLSTQKHTLLHNLPEKEKGYSHRRPEETLHPVLLTWTLAFYYGFLLLSNRILLQREPSKEVV